MLYSWEVSGAGRFEVARGVKAGICGLLGGRCKSARAIWAVGGEVAMVILAAC
jgi:hypothetical protein